MHPLRKPIIQAPLAVQGALFDLLTQGQVRWGEEVQEILALVANECYNEAVADRRTPSADPREG